MITTETSEHPLKLEEGWICLDFANTGIEVQDLTDVRDLVGWAREIGLLSGDEADRLKQEAQAVPSDADGTLSKARRQRGLIRRILGAIASGHTPADEDLQSLNRLLNEAFSQLCLIPTESGYVFGWKEWSAVDCVLWPVVKSAADLLCSDDLRRVGQCAAENCERLFLDTSKNHSRRWCSMRRCGNRAKVNRYHRRQQT